MSDYFDKYYRQLEGAQIVKFLGIRADDFGAEGFPVFRVIDSAGESWEIEISKDPEGNGGGFIFGLPLPA
jgi:hypothetical protein